MKLNMREGNICSYVSYSSQVLICGYVGMWLCGYTILGRAELIASSELVGINWIGQLTLTQLKWSKHDLNAQ